MHQPFRYRLRARRRDESGTTLVEVVVSGFLAVVMSGAALVALMGFQRTASAIQLRSGSRTETRETIEKTMRELRSAAPLGLCLSPKGQTPEPCSKPGEYTLALDTEVPRSNPVDAGEPASPLARADDDGVCFWRYEPHTSAATALRAPDRVCLATRVDPDNGEQQLVLRVNQADPGATYNNPSWLGVGPDRLIGRYSPSDSGTALFTYTDTAGESMDAPGTDPEKTWRVAEVRLSVELRLSRGGKEVAVPLDLVAALRSARYGTDRCWKANQCDA